MASTQAGGRRRVLIDLSAGQLHKLADIIHLQEVEKLKELKFNSFGDQQRYLNDSRRAREDVHNILTSAGTAKAKAKEERDATKVEIAHDVYEYCTKSIGVSLQLIRSYNTRLTYLGKLKSHSECLIEQLYRLNPATQMKEAQRLALEAGMYKKATLDYAKKLQHFIPNQFTKWLKDTGMKFEDLVQHYMAKLNFKGPFKYLSDIQKLELYEKIIEAAGRGKAIVTCAFKALKSVGVALLLFTAAMMVWDIYTAENKLETAVRDSVVALTGVVSLVVGKLATTAIAAGFVALEIEVAAVALTVIGVAVGIGVGVVIGIAAGALLDLVFNSGTTKVVSTNNAVNSTDGLTSCRVAPMPDGLHLARLVKYNHPDL